MAQSYTEENYLKAIYKLSLRAPEGVSTNALADRMDTKASSVTDMIKRLHDKGLVHYQKYQGVQLTEQGRQIAVAIIRKHRLWEVFLVEKLHFSGETVHDVAEQLEHIASVELTQRLDAFLGYPKYDPHGGPIPDEQGNFPMAVRVKLDELEVGRTSKVMGVTEHSEAFMDYLRKVGLGLGTAFTLLDRHPFDHSVEIQVDSKAVHLSYEVARHIFVSN